MKLLFSLFGLFFYPFVFGQILTVNSGASVSVASSSSINLDGLEIAPADTTEKLNPMKTSLKARVFSSRLNW